MQHQILILTARASSVCITIAHILESRPWQTGTLGIYEVGCRSVSHIALLISQRLPKAHLCLYETRVKSSNMMTWVILVCNHLTPRTWINIGTICGNQDQEGSSKRTTRSPGCRQGSDILWPCNLFNGGKQAQGTSRGSSLMKSTKMKKPETSHSMIPEKPAVWSSDDWKSHRRIQGKRLKRQLRDL